MATGLNLTCYFIFTAIDTKLDSPSVLLSEITRGNITNIFFDTFLKDNYYYNNNNKGSGKD